MAQDVWDQVEHKYADANGVKIHYAALGQGPLVVMIHGFPDFWYIVAQANARARRRRLSRRRGRSARLQPFGQTERRRELRDAATGR